jgi:hypothetical protein
MQLPANLGATDRLLRGGAALLLVLLELTGRFSGLTSLLMGLVAAMLLLTSAMGSCLLYMPLRLSTRR